MVDGGACLVITTVPVRVQEFYHCLFQTQHTITAGGFGAVRC